MDPPINCQSNSEKRQDTSDSGPEIGESSTDARSAQKVLCRHAMNSLILRFKTMPVLAFGAPLWELRTLLGIEKPVVRLASDG